MSTLEVEPRKLIIGQAELRQAQETLKATGARPGEWTAGRSDGTSIAVPRELSAVITSILEVIARGGTVTVGAMPQDLTTTTAAELLGISRPTLMKLVDVGEIDAHKVGTHTRLKSADVLAFRRARIERQRQAFEALRELEDEDELAR